MKSLYLLWPQLLVVAIFVAAAVVFLRNEQFVTVLCG